MKASVSIQTGQKDPMKQKVRDVEEPLSISELVSPRPTTITIQT